MIQEVVLANDHVPRLAIWGDIEFAWEDLAKVAYRLAAYNLYLVLAGQSVSMYSSLQHPLTFPQAPPCRS